MGLDNVMKVRGGVGFSEETEGKSAVSAYVSDMFSMLASMK